MSRTRITCRCCRGPCRRSQVAQPAAAATVEFRQQLYWVRLLLLLLPWLLLPPLLLGALAVAAAACVCVGAAAAAAPGGGGGVAGARDGYSTVTPPPVQGRRADTPRVMTCDLVRAYMYKYKHTTNTELRFGNRKLRKRISFILVKFEDVDTQECETSGKKDYQK